MKHSSWLSVIALAGLILWGCSPESSRGNNRYDVVVYGGTSAGVIAAYTAWKQGYDVVLIEAGNHLGGLTAGGLGQTDIGNKYAVQGLARKFYRDLGYHYGIFEAWKFEPHAAENLFNAMMAGSDVSVLKRYRLRTVEKKSTRILSIVLESSDDTTNIHHISGNVFIDCSYEGDLMAKAGVSYTVGRESNKTYGEQYNGFQLRDKHQFPDHIDPYVVPGDPSSGLIYGIDPTPVAATGTGDHRVQAYNFRLCMTKDTNNMIPVTRPEDYDPTRYELLRRVIRQRDSLGWIQRLHQLYLKIDMMPNGKTDINNKGPQSTDFIGENWEYPEARYTERERIWKAHESYIKGLLYFLGHDPDIPEEIRSQMLEWGWASDEFTDNGGFPHQMYVREARRMLGEYVMTEHNCLGNSTIQDGIALAAYTMDSHNCQRIVVNGMVKNEGDVQVGGFPPYEISYRSIVPLRKECTNLLVPVCLSASHIAFGSIRMEPVFMVLGQVAGLAADLSLRSGIPVQGVDPACIKNVFQTDPYLDGTPPDIEIDNTDSSRLSYSGNWEITSRWMDQYRHNFLMHPDPGPEVIADFHFCPQKDGIYEIYLYVPSKPTIDVGNTWQWETRMPLTICHAGSEDIVLLDLESSERNWASAGTWSFIEGDTVHVRFRGSEELDPVALDALLVVYQDR